MTSTSSDVAPNPPVEISLRREAGLFQVAAYGIGNVVGAGIYVLVGDAAAQNSRSLKGVSPIGLRSHFKAEYTVRQIRILAVYGILAPLVYVLALAIGNSLDPSYSQTGKTVSELVERGAPNRDLLNGIFVVYNLLLIPFAEGLYKGLKKGSPAKIVFASLVLMSVLGVAWTLFFPLDANGASTSFTGMMHLIIGIPVVFATFLAELSFWRAVRSDSRWAGYARFSLIIFAVNLLAGLTTVALLNSDIRGLLERFASGSFLLWIEVVGLKLYKTPSRTSDQG